MQHNIPYSELGNAERGMAHAIESCVHCGFCLPACPTYVELAEEMDSPRGRIFLMKEVLEGNLAAQDAAPYIDRCLGCLGCVTACPSGVEYDALITLYRARSEGERRRGIASTLFRKLILRTLPSPRLFRAAIRMSAIARPFVKLLPGRVGAMLQLVPDAIPPAVVLPEVVPAEGPRRGRVALLIGCAQQVLAPEINSATIRVLTKNGIEVVIPKNQRCCGALAAHTGDMSSARKLAAHNVSTFPHDVDAIITNAAGCGSGLKEYPMWLEDQNDNARHFAERSIDVSEYLMGLGLIDPPQQDVALRVAYHDACHLSHGQGVRNAPRKLLQAIPGVEVVEIRDRDFCCGSAGTYSIEQPELAKNMGERKAQAVIDTQTRVVAMGNIGCMTQIALHLRLLGSDIEVKHTMELLDAAYRGVLAKVP